MDCGEKRLSLARIGLDNLKLIEEEYYGLKWNRDGEVRTVPRHIIENALREWRDGLKVAGERLGETLIHYHGINWEQAV